MTVERWPEHRLIAYPARPCRVPAAVAETGLVPDEDLIRTEGVTGQRVGGLGDPLPGRRLHQVARHDHKPRCPVWPASTANNTGLDPVPAGI